MNYKKFIFSYFIAMLILFSFSPMDVYAGLEKSPGGNRFMDENGNYASSKWENLYGDWYYFGSDTYMKKNSWLSYEGNYYYFDNNGVMVKGLKLVDNKLAYFLDSGIFSNYIDQINGIDKEFLSEAISNTSKHNKDIEYALKEINNIRKNAGMSPLMPDDTLSILANYRNIEMDRNNYFSHYYKDELRYSKLAELFNIKYIYLGENLFKSNFQSYKSMTELIDNGNNAYIKSASHYANIISPNFNKIGIGLYIVDNSRFYYSMIFKH